MLSYNSKVSANNPALKGQLAGQKLLFGEFSRYAVAPIFTRFEAVEWFVWDAEILNSYGNPEVIRQASSFEEAVNGLY